MNNTVPVYAWFDEAPEHLKTRRQLAELALRPAGPVRGRVVWKRGKRFADLYDQNEAKPKKEATPAQLEALKKAQEKRRTCPICNSVLSYVVTRWNVEHCPVCEYDMRKEELESVRNTARKWLNESLILDTETTDLDGYLVQIAVIDTSGAVLLDTLVNPLAPISEGARAVHGITEEQLKDQPTFEQILSTLSDIVADRRVVVYNASFDIGILNNEFRRIWPEDYRREWSFWFKSIRWCCAMELYAEYVGDWSEYHGSYRWQQLPGGDHTALGDCRATLALLQRMSEE